MRARVALINAVRFSLKSLGYPVSNPSSARFHKLVLNEVPDSIGGMIAHNVAAIAELTERIKALDTSISCLAAERYPQTMYLQQVSGVGPITSLYFVLKVGNPGRFQRARDIGAFLGLCPKRDQSGEIDKELRISQMRRSISATPPGERRAVYSRTLWARQCAARARTTSCQGGNSKGQEAGRRGRRTKARRIAPHALEIP